MESEQYAFSPLVLKATLTLGILLASLFSVYLPIYSYLPVRSALSGKSLAGSLANCFTAGVFAAVALLHLLPEANTQLSQYYATNYPWAFLLALGGYLLILFVEKVACDSHSFLKHEHTIKTEEAYSYKQEEEAFSELMLNRVKLMKGLSDSQPGDNVDMQARLLAHYADTKQVQSTGVGAYVLALALSTHAVESM